MYVYFNAINKINTNIYYRKAELSFSCPACFDSIVNNMKVAAEILIFEVWCFYDRASLI